ncbi:TPA: hypothetical protein RKY22_004920 [Klebsiella michiganensis]|jgi:hypothetical protein|uniref:hypothetical protein n=1 Tax=Phytobacter diazotrophicus TaxID=395631 RepID=UPI001451292C|nr:hypothetical protein [Phytobacter diazotrophicus]QJF20063.1 hypothetical protein HHA33_26135 [Phytobacter diazotrophicus]HDS8282023.1 hypothetical protein [Klebsiella variicola]HDW0214337.1 hypothetical protein [Klebsiella michiganensis]
MTFTSRVKSVAATMFLKAGVPEQQLRTRMKSVGQNMLLASTLAIVPLVMFDDVSVAVKIILQLVYALLICGGVILTVEEKKK